MKIELYEAILPASNRNSHQTSNLSRILVCNKLVDHSDVVGALSVGTASSTSSIAHWHLAAKDWEKTTARRETFKFWDLVSLTLKVFTGKQNTLRYTCVWFIDTEQLAKTTDDLYLSMVPVTLWELCIFPSTKLSSTWCTLSYWHFHTIKLCRNSLKIALWSRRHNWCYFQRCGSCGSTYLCIYLLTLWYSHLESIPYETSSSGFIGAGSYKYRSYLISIYELF